MQEAMFKAFAHAAADPILVCSVDGAIQSANPAATRIYGVVEGRNIRTLIWPGSKAVFAKIWDRVVKGQALLEQPLETALEDSSRLMTNASFVPVEQKGKLILCTLKDSVEFRRLFGQLVQAEKMASLGRLASGIAHQLNTPLGSILLTSQLLLDSIPDEESQGDLHKIIRQTTQCRDIISNFLQLSRSPGELDRREVFTLPSIIDEITDLLAKPLREKNIVVNKQFQCGVCQIVGNRPLLHQLFANLISNALDAMPDSGGEIKILTGCSPGIIKIVINDQGPGIPENHRQAIFDPFFTTKPMGQGTGLGLYLALRIAQEHGGTLELKESQPGGSSFEVTLPHACATPPENFRRE